MKKSAHFLRVTMKFSACVVSLFMCVYGCVCVCKRGNEKDIEIE